MKYFQSSNRTSHTVSQSKSLRNIPSTSDRKPGARNPAPVTPHTRRCASCGGGQKRF